MFYSYTKSRGMNVIFILELRVNNEYTKFLQGLSNVPPLFKPVYLILWLKLL